MGDKAERKWWEIKLNISPKAVEVLREAGNGRNYAYYPQKVLGDDPKHGMRKIMSATV